LKLRARAIYGVGLYGAGYSEYEYM